MLRAVLFIFSILFYMSSTAQFYDRSWIVGAGQALVKLTFNGSSFDTASYYFNTNGIGINSASSDVSDTAGNILFYTNGAMVANGLTQIMENGDTLTDSLFYSMFASGFSEPQTDLILPRSDNTFYLFYYSESDSLLSLHIGQPDRLYYAIIDMNANGGLGKVVSKKNVVHKGIIGDCRLTACRHANGGDWWIVHQGFENNEYFTYLVTPDSVYPLQIQYIGPSDFYQDNLAAQSSFSPDGSKFTTVSAIGPLEIMNFDRCTGIFSNPDSIFIPIDSFWYNGTYDFPTTNGGTGCCFSANGRFLYFTNSIDIVQYDTWAPNLA